MLKSICSIAACALCLCRAQPLDWASSQPAGGPADELAVLAVALDHAVTPRWPQAGAPPRPPVVIAATTATREGDTGVPWGRSGREGPEQPVFTEIRRDYAARNLRPISLPARLGRTNAARFRWSPNDPRPDSREFEKRFLADRFYVLSRPGFDAGRMHAVVHLQEMCVGWCGYGALLQLTRTRDGWKVTGDETTWLA